ncbi:MAG: hypothetical protein KC457_27165 [Myxococcales bacterium]|nr:hypothetical protein [Myxococcales bacterium]
MEGFVITPAESAPTEPAPTEPAPTVVVVPAQLPPAFAPAPPVTGSYLPPRWIATPPRSGSGRLVGGPVIALAGVGLLTAATFEFADGRDTTKVLISSVPAGIAMLIAGGVMIGTGVRDQHTLSEWEAANRMDAPGTGNGLIVGGVTLATLGTLAAITTSIASDMDLNAPRSIPAGWATAGVAIGAGTALLIGGISRRARYSHWRSHLMASPTVAPVRAGAAVGLWGQF